MCLEYFFVPCRFISKNDEVNYLVWMYYARVGMYFSTETKIRFVISNDNQFNLLKKMITFKFK